MYIRHVTGQESIGEQNNLEMMTLAISFSVNDYDRTISEIEKSIISNYFESLNLMNRTIETGFIQQEIVLK